MSSRSLLVLTFCLRFATLILAALLEASLLRCVSLRFLVAMMASLILPFLALIKGLAPLGLLVAELMLENLGAWGTLGRAIKLDG